MKKIRGAAKEGEEKRETREGKTIREKTIPPAKGLMSKKRGEGRRKDMEENEREEKGCTLMEEIHKITTDLNGLLVEATSVRLTVKKRAADVPALTTG